MPTDTLEKPQVEVTPEGQRIKTKHLPASLAHTKDLGEGMVEVIIATDSVDRHGEIVDIETLDVSQYNGVVLLGHDYWGLPIGKGMNIRKERRGESWVLIGETKFAIEEFDLANTVYKLVVGGYMPDVSIGFIPKEYDLENDKWLNAEMIEYSHVTVGSNRDAKVTAKALQKVGVTAAEFKSQLDRFEELAKAKQSELETKADEGEGGDETPPETPAPTPGVDTPPETDTQTTPDEAVQKEGEETPSPSEQHESIERLQALIPAMEETLAAAKRYVDAALQSRGSDLPSQKKRRIMLVKARSTGSALDRLAEVLISECKEAINVKGKA